MSLLTDCSSLREHYEIEGRDLERYESSSYWDARYHQHRFKLICNVLDNLSPDGVNFVDVGAGTGEYLEHMRSAGAAKVVAVDLSFAYCARLSRVSSLVSQSSGVALSLKSGSADIVLCSEVIEHVPPSEARSVIAELCRVATRAVIVTTPNRRAAIRRLGRLVAPHAVDALDLEVGHINLMTASELEVLIGIPGWRLHTVQVAHILPPVIGERLRIPPSSSCVISRLERWATAASGSSGNAMIAVLTKV
jgi:SAM-dependent methyltransferase